jgi:hypothetical protein
LPTGPTKDIQPKAILGFGAAKTTRYFNEIAVTYFNVIILIYFCTAILLVVF